MLFLFSPTFTITVIIKHIYTLHDSDPSIDSPGRFYNNSIHFYALFFQIAMISGSTKGVLLDLDSNIDRKSIVDLLEAKGISWKSYQQAYPG